MQRGWLCIWRKIEDNVSWSYGIEYRGLMVTILQKANWKPGYFLGHKINPGQFPTSAENLGNDLKVSRQKCQRMLKKLAKDEFIIVENVSNRFTLITVINWDAYQDIKMINEQHVSNQRATDEQPMSNQRAAGEQQVGTIKQRNKETKKQGNNNITPQPPKGGQGDKSPEEPKPKSEFSGRVPQAYHPVFEQFWKEYPMRNGKKGSKRKAFEAWWRAMRDKLTTPEKIIADIIRLRASYNEYPPDAVTWINGRRWEDELGKSLPLRGAPAASAGGKHDNFRKFLRQDMAKIRGEVNQDG